MNIPKPQTIEVSVNSMLLSDIKILHLSDLHVNKKISRESLQALIDNCNILEYDIAIITGDIIDCKAKFIKEKLKILNLLKQKVYYISGNHDIFYGIEDLKNELKNFIFMDNQCISITIDEKRINICGLPDRFSTFFKIKREEKMITKFLQQNSATIFMAHQPKDYKIALKSNASLFLCGHTHGGQIFPFHYLVRLFQPFLKGLHYRNKTAIYVSSGLGTWGINYRFKAQNEITILKLVYNNA